MFKEHTGETFHHYVTKSRLRRAEHLARTTDLKLYEIAEKVGYPSSRYFSKLYKKQIGKQLSQVRARTIRVKDKPKKD
jgi:two-component system, response regulator YesN